MTSSSYYLRNDVLHQELRIHYVTKTINEFYEKFHRKLLSHKNIFVRRLRTPQLTNLNGLGETGIEIFLCNNIIL